MKKVIIISLFACVILSWCSQNIPKTNPAEQACLGATSMIIQTFNEDNKSSLEGEWEWWVCDVLDVIYSKRNASCYIGYVCDGDAHISYMIGPITLQWSGLKYGEQEIIDTCASFDGLVQAINPELTWEALAKAEHESLCKYKEEEIQAKYKARIQQLKE